MDTSIRTQDQLALIKQFNCPNCGNALEVLHPRVKEIACKYCGSVLDARSETYQILKELGKPTRHTPMSFIQIGLVGQLGGHTYQVIARTRWRMNYMEYWSDEDGSGYSKEVWVYDEWLLLSENRTYFYLIEDKEGYWVSEEIIPELPQLKPPKNMHMKFFQNQRPRRVREYGEAKVIYFEGESNYQIGLGDQIQFTMFRDRGIDYSSEWRVGKNSKDIKEVEFFKETPISRRRLLEAFKENPAVVQILQREANWAFVFRVALFSFLGMLGLLLFSAFNPGRSIFSQQVEINAQLSETQSLLSEPINISDPGLYQLRLRTQSLPENTEVYIFAYVLDEAQVAVNSVGGNFYHWTGVDDEGRWTETDKTTRKLFRLKEPGTYYVQVYASHENDYMGPLSIQVNKGIWLSRYFLVGVILLFFPLVISFIKKGGI